MRGARGLHPVCRARVEEAARRARPGDVVVLSGWARTPGGRSEAALMREAWPGPADGLVLDDGAAHTAQNAAHVARIAREAGADEVLVVTSRWHARRAAVAFRALLRGSGVRVEVAGADGPGGVRARAREAVVWPAFGVQLARARRRR